MAHGSNPPGDGDVGEHPILPPGMALRASQFSPVLDRSDDHEDGLTPSPTGCQAGRGRKLTRVGKKLLALDGRTPDHSGICPATLT